MVAKVRLFVDEPLAGQAQLALAAGPSHYLRHVMRAAAGEDVRLFNGRDGEWQARIVPAGRSGCLARIERCLRPQADESGPWLVFAPLKKAAMDIVVEKAVELGAERLLPVTTRFSSVERVNLERLQAQAIEAAEQCGRMTVPAIEPLGALQGVLDDWPAKRPLLFLDERAGERSLVDAIGALAAPPGDGVQPGILVGPEGGFAEDEATAIRRRAFITAVSLGPRILRAETAALAALACWQAFAGDWRADQRSKA